MSEQRVILTAVVGSRLYGTARPDSDTDLRSVAVSPLLDVLSPFRRTRDRHLQEGDEDHGTYELRTFCRLAAEGHPLALETLVGTPVRAEPDGEVLRALLPAFLSRRCAEAFLNYERNKERKFRSEPPPAKGKHAASMVRILLQLRRLLRDGAYDASFTEKERAELVGIAAGLESDAAVMTRVLALEHECLALKEKSALPAEPDIARIEAFLLEAYAA